MFPRTRDKMKIILEELNLPFYDPFLIIQKRKGRWRKMISGLRSRGDASAAAHVPVFVRVKRIKHNKCGMSHRSGEASPFYSQLFSESFAKFTKAFLEQEDSTTEKGIAITVT